MKKICLPHNSLRQAFTLIEAVITVAIIGVMASIVVASISNLSRDSQRIVGRQQQAQVQNALNAWVMSQTRVGTTSQIMSTSDIRALYNSETTALGKFNRFISPDQGTGLGGYIDVATADHFRSNTTNNQRLKTSALNLASQHLELPTWTSGGSPRVDLVND